MLAIIDSLYEFILTSQIRLLLVLEVELNQRHRKENKKKEE